MPTLVDLGTSPNSGTGDPLLTAFTKVNGNFTEVIIDMADKEDVSNKGVANGYASLNSNGDVPDGQIDAIIARLQLGTLQTFTGQIEFDRKVLFPAADVTVTASLNMPNSSGNTAVAGDLYAAAGELKWHDGVTVRTLAYTGGGGSGATASFARTFLHMGA